MADEAKLLDYLKRVTADLHQVRQRLREVEAGEQEPIAIVAMGCRFPGGVRSPEELWELVASGRDVIADFPADRGWDLGTLYDPDPEQAGTSYTRQGGFVHDAADFDAGLLRHLAPRGAGDGPAAAAAAGDLVGGARAGRHRPALAARAAAPASSSAAPATDYGTVLMGAAPRASKGYLLTGNAGSVVSGRIAYTLGLEGPAVTVDTACSSSLVALHLAGQALRQRRVRPGPGRRRHRDVPPRPPSSSSPGSAASPPTAGARRSPPPPTAPAGPRASASWCWSGSRTRSATATRSSPWCAAARSTRTAPPTA